MIRSYNKIRHLLQIFISRHTRKTVNAPFILYMILTSRCNLQCVMCDIWKKNRNISKKNQNKELSTEEVLDVIRDVSDMGCKIFSISGGEPLLRKDICTIIKEIKNLGGYAVLDTNGTLINAKRAKELAHAGLDKAAISLDSSISDKHDQIRGKKGVFQDVKNAVGLLKKEKISVSFNVCVMKSNADEMVSMVKLCKQLGVKDLRFIPILKGFHYNDPKSFNNDEHEWSENRLKNFRQQIKLAEEYAGKNNISIGSKQYVNGMIGFFNGRQKIPECYAGYLYALVDSGGYVLPCTNLKTLKSCNIRQHPFKNIWNSKDFEKLRARVKNGDCKDCWDFCYTEPNLRYSLLSVFKNPSLAFKEIKTFLR